MDRAWKANSIKTLIPGLRIVHAEIATTTSGTLASTYVKQYGIKLTKTGGQTGRYTVNLLKSTGDNANAVYLVNAIVTLIGPDTAALTTTKGLVSVLRADDVGRNNNDGTFEVQFVQTNSGNADTEVNDGAVIKLTLFLCDSTST